MEKYNIEPLGDRVLIQEIRAGIKTNEEDSEPDSSKQSPLKGKVLAVGKGEYGQLMSVKAGDTILYGKYSGVKITMGGLDALIMKESEIFAILKLTN